MIDSTNLPDVDINQIATDLNGKMDRDGVNASCPTLLSRTANSYGGVVEIWSDGYCVQNGYANYSTNPLTINLSVEMLDTNYIALAIEQNPGGGCWTQITGKSKTTVSIGRFYASGSAGSAGSSRDVNWEVKGYIR